MSASKTTKFLFLMALALFTIFSFCQKDYAATITNRYAATDNVFSVNDSQPLTGTVLPTGVIPGTNAVFTSYLKFNLSALKGKNITSATLKLFQTTNLQGAGNSQTIQVNSSSNTSWTEADAFTTPPISNWRSLFPTNGLLAENTFSVPSESHISFNLLNDVFRNDVQNGNITLLLTGQPQLSFIASNQAENICKRPELTIEANNAPVPEPSSIIFGLLGLGGLISRKRKKTAVR